MENENLENINTDCSDQDAILSDTCWIRSDEGTDISLKINEDPNPKAHDIDITSYTVCTSSEDEDTLLNDTGWIPSDHGMDANLEACDIGEIAGTLENYYLPRVPEQTNYSTHNNYTCLDRGNSYPTWDSLNIERPAAIDVDSTDVVSRVLENFDKMSLAYLLSILESHAELLWYFVIVQLVLMLLALLHTLKYCTFREPDFLLVLRTARSTYRLFNLMLIFSPIIILCFTIHWSLTILEYLWHHYRFRFFGYRPMGEAKLYRFGSGPYTVIEPEVLDVPYYSISVLQGLFAVAFCIIAYTYWAYEYYYYTSETFRWLIRIGVAILVFIINTHIQF